MRPLLLPAGSLAWRELLRFFRERNRVIGALGTPLVFWLLIGSGFRRSFRPPGAPEGSDYLAYLLPGSAVLIVLFAAIFSTISIIEDRREGFLQGVLVAPIPRSALVLGKLLGGSAVAFLQAFAFLLLAPLVGSPLRPAGLALAGGVLFAVAFGLTGLGFLIAWRMESVQGFHAVMNLFLMPLWLLSGALFPASGATPWLGAAMAANPLTYGVSALRRSLAAPGASFATGLPSLSLSLGVSLLFCALTCAGSIAIARRRGAAA